MDPQHLDSCYDYDPVFHITHIFLVVWENRPFRSLSVYYLDDLYANEAMRRTKRGRPSSTRIRTEMDDFPKQPRKCGLCGTLGHNRSNCPNVAGPSTQH
ncbi:hypothetical protein QL285_053455 [Trifolium repens]|nr:hypothetical protein QL285_053455 [Trifolium repens]